MAGGTALAALFVLPIAVLRDDVADSWLDQCTDASRAEARAMAEIVDRELPHRDGPVRIRGLCRDDGDYRPSIDTSVSVDRGVLARALKARWGCRWNSGWSDSVIGRWDCPQVGSMAAEVMAHPDGAVSIRVSRGVPSQG